jgi:CBS domain containing-hemolysin-like protein
LLIAGEFVARGLGRKWSTGVLVLFLPLLSRLSLPFRPLEVFGRRTEDRDTEAPEPAVVEAAKEEIRVAIEDGTTEGALQVDEKQMIEGILEFRNVDVGSIMTPRTEIENLDAKTRLPEALRRLEAFRHSRIPVFEGTLDHIVGIVYVKDLLSASGRADSDALALADVMRKPFFVPETKTVGLLLQQFRDQHIQIAVVLDEYGGVSGVVTVEDIMEEIVGEIEDEYDDEDHESRIVTRSPSSVEVDARTDIDEVNEILDVDIPEDEDYDTIAGFVTAHFARVPETGEEFIAHGLRVRVLQSDERRVRRVLLERVGPSGPEH